MVTDKAKEVILHPEAEKSIGSLPYGVKRKVLHQIKRLGLGHSPADEKPFPEADQSLRKMRFINEGLRVPYFEHEEKIWILSPFRKTNTTRQADINKAVAQYNEIMGEK